MSHHIAQFLVPVHSGRVPGSRPPQAAGRGAGLRHGELAMAGGSGGTALGPGRPVPVPPQGVLEYVL